MTGFKTVTFAKHEGVDIKLDYMLPAAATPGSKVPILLWFHGGGLLMGTRTCAWSHLVNAVEKHNLCLVTADYRLAPQTRMPGIMLDVKAVMDYLNSPDFLVETGGVVDQQKIIVSGGSAGGWLALLIATGVGFEACGLMAPPKPLAVAPLYPITDIEAHFFTSKQYPVSYVKQMIPESAVAPFLDPNAPQSSECALTSPRMKMYPYMVQEAIEQQLLLEGTSIPASAFSIAPAVAAGQCSMPPMYIVHGTIDDKVPISQSEDVVKACQARGFEVEFEVLEGVDHLFDMDPKYQLENMYAFIDKLVK
ncbi:uncharacterized protein EHS24_002426 [Apiotrichum porosum]|uniref:BD-FAE-like domain-containing protein n=1 Tax=Apiotrichum porosum TaxID=105984 RepID=A0A427XIY6_9TREE|nr:uncharacterized protein EHS24_002426 [Apiotrichum porosum]RSH78697.1 hypothetical protein EHS24_002426 [Apiotrichum porosum]